MILVNQGNVKAKELVVDAGEPCGGLAQPCPLRSLTVEFDMVTAENAKRLLVL